MTSIAIPFRTAEGRAELSTRQRRMSQRHRTVLFLVDGKRDAAEVCRMALQAGVAEACFDELVASGLIELPAVHAPMDSAPHVTPARMALPIVDAPPPGVETQMIEAEAPLPPSRTLSPESAAGVLNASAARSVSAWQALTTTSAADLDDLDDADPADPAFLEARAVLVRAVRIEAPLAGSLTLMRLRRARCREDLHGLLDEVEARIAKPHRALTTQQTMRRVRLLLGSQPSSLLDFA